ncbi:MAG: amidohydrolase [Saprospiraceae bacterium]|nr:amidohydrolase [Saprospiraceae bacterium]
MHPSILKQFLKEIETDLIAIRRNFHAHPELSFAERNTSLLIQTCLNRWNQSFTNGWAGHGIVGLIEGEAGPSDKVVCIRADMDALPIQEKNDLDYKSTFPGIMHACGHDMHMSCLLGAIYALQKSKSNWAGTVKFIFQPGEEQLPGGASIMISEGVLKDPAVHAVIGLHVQPNLEVGKIGICPGPSMASSEEIFIELTSQGGHAAMPHLVGDPVFASAKLISGVQELLSRTKPPLVPAVVGFGKVTTEGGATNVIPQRVLLEGTFRTLDAAYRELFCAMLPGFIDSMTSSFQVGSKTKLVKGYPVLVNDPHLAKIWKESAIQYTDNESVVEISPRLTAEDFARYSEIVPGCFFRLGTGPSANVHSPEFVADDRAIVIGAGVMGHAAIQFLQNV